MLLWLLRTCYAALVIVMAVIAFTIFADRDVGGNVWAGVQATAVVLVAGGIVMFTDLYEKDKQITTISAVYFGLLFGLLLGWLFTLALEPLMSDWLTAPAQQLAKFGVNVLSCYVSISTLLQTKDEFRFIIPYVEFSKQSKGAKPLVLDTSVIIDGRIADICDTKIIDGKLIVPRFVLQELQGIADSSDKLKRNRGRRGLDILKRMQNNPETDLQVHEGSAPTRQDAKKGERLRVDERLVLFAQSVAGRVVTNDFNLNKIAQLQGVEVINLNEVANALKTVALPGEVLNLKVVKAGDQPGQGVGYLEDGTMVVIERARESIGQEVGITVTSVIQTPAGRMVFGRLGETGEHRALAAAGDGRAGRD